MTKQAIRSDDSPGSRFLRLFQVGATALALAGCGPSGGEHEIDEVRDLRRGRGEVRRPVTDSERFEATEASRDAPARESPLRYDVPEGWVELPPSSMRLIDLRVEARPEVECYLTLLPGSGGGVLENVNRWRRQVGLDPIGAEDLDDLPRATLFSREAVFVDLAGTYTGMDGEPREGFAIKGLIAESAGGMTAFLKMIGPAADVEAETERLLAFAESLDILMDEAHTGGAAETAERSDDPRDQAGGLRFERPEGWTDGAARPMRMITLHPGGDESVECYVATLGGDGGGLLANLNRWRQQLGATPLSEADLEALPQVDVLGAPCRLLEVEGRYTGMDGVSHDDYALLGVVRLLPQAALFVKMIGPAERVRAERERFISFCESLGF